MTFADAVVADREGRMQAAADAYEEALLANPRDVSLVLDLAVLYWQATDFGISAAAHLSPEFVARAGTRFRELLDAALKEFGDRPEVLFWTHYIAWADLGEPFDEAVCRQLLRQHPDYLEPALLLFSSSGGTEAEAEAMRLLEHCAEERNARCRYVASVVNGVLKRR